MTAPGHAGQVYELSGPRLVTWREAVEEIAAAGVPVRYTPVSAGAYHEDLLARGCPAGYAAAVGGLFEHIRQGRSERLSDGVRRVLGRPPLDFAAFVRRQFRPAAARG